MLSAGIDEAGRGPLAGPVFAAAVILDPAQPHSRAARFEGADGRSGARNSPSQIRERAIAWAVASADVNEIDTLNILQATLLAMRRAVEALSVAPLEAIVDGNQCPRLPCPVYAIVKGDRDVASISAASILAKTARDALLIELDRAVPAVRLRAATRATARRSISRRSTGTGRARSIGAASRRWRRCRLPF